MKSKKLTSLGLALTMVTTAMPAMATVTPVDGGHEANVEHAGEKPTEAEVCAKQTVDTNESASCTVYAELGSEFVVTVPKSLTLDGTTKKGAYTVSVEGDIAGYEKVNVVPDENFALNSAGLNDVTASIEQDKTSWLFNEMLVDNKVIGNGEIDANGITAGAWNGTFNFNIKLEGAGITVTSKDSEGNDLNASASEITGTEKDNLLDSLVNTGMVTSKEDVDALIEVESDEFEGMADTTFDVSSIAKEGDKVAILHFNEEKQEWEYIGTETVDTNGNISADFSSYSPVAFVKVNNDGTSNDIIIPKLSECTPTQIKEIIDAGNAQTYFKVGDTTTITLTTGEQITVAIAGFNHDTLSDGSGKATITFAMTETLNSWTYMNSSETNSGGWKGSRLYSKMNDYYNTLPQDWKSLVKTVNKRTNNYGKGLTSSYSITTTQEKVFLFSVMEIFGYHNTYDLDGDFAQLEGTQYEYFKNDNNKIVGEYYWTRTPSTEFDGFMRVYQDAPVFTSNCASDYDQGIRFGFCI